MHVNMKGRKRMKWLVNSYFILALLAWNSLVNAQTWPPADWEQNALKAQEELNDFYKNAPGSPLDPKQKKKFKKHDFYPVSDKYVVNARLEKDSSHQIFKLKTTTSRLPEYRVYAVAHFELNGNPCKLALYQMVQTVAKPGYNGLFLPFKDLSNGESTYDLGRYINLEIPSGDQITIDFNQSYYPYCAYSDKFSCPLVPLANHLEVIIEAGIKGIPKKLKH